MVYLLRSSLAVDIIIMKLAEAIGALLLNGNGWANSSFIQSDPFAEVFLFLVFLETRDVYIFSDKIHTYKSRRFRNKCDIVEEPNSSSKCGVSLMFIALGMIANVT